MPSSRLSGVLGLLLITQGCGLFGSVDRSRQPIIYSARGHGCLNGIKGKVTRYFRGEIEASEWNQPWDCTQNSLQTLDDLIAGKGGIDVSDAHTLFSKVLLTEKPFPMRLTEALLGLKSAIVGGSPMRVSREELARVRHFIRVFQEQTNALLPALKGKRAPRDGLRLAGEAHAAFAAINAALPPETRLPISRAMIQTLVDEGTRVLDWEVSVDLTEIAIAGKQLFAGGAGNEIEARAWADALEIFSKLAAVALAYRRVDPALALLPNETWEFNYGLARIASDALKGSIALHGGAIPLERFERLIDAAPDGLTTFRKSTIKKVLDSATRRLFPSQRPRTFDAAFLDRAMARFDEWRRRQTTLEFIYGRSSLDPAGVTPEEFVSAAQELASTSGPEGQAEIGGLIALAQRVRPLFSGRDNEIVIQGPSPGKLSLNGLGIVQTIDVAARLVFESYSSLPGRDGVALADAEAIVEDFQQLSIDRGTLDPTVPQYARRRFREASSYGPVSDGDAKIDLNELTHYAAYVYSIEALAIRLRGLVEEKCKVSDELDTMKWKRMDARCFRQVYFGNVDTLWDHFPRLQAHYRSLDAEGRAKLERMIEHAARHKGHNDEPVGGYEAQSFSAVVHFEEAYFERFDSNRDDRIQTEEALVAARNHRRNIAEAGNIDPTKHGILDAIYVFGVKHGRRPVRRGLGLVEFLAWLARRPFWNLGATSAEIFRASPLANTVPASEPPGRTE